MYFTHNECKSVTTERFIKALKVKTYPKMTANDNNSYLPYLNKLADQHNNPCTFKIKKDIIVKKIVGNLCGKESFRSTL